ncbi:MAG: hypothetical protein NTV75_08890 [Bacteroidia bacterium]|nr:hypothetical protein [Bacteroidia bacterium]
MKNSSGIDSFISRPISAGRLCFVIITRIVLAWFVLISLTFTTQGLPLANKVNAPLTAYEEVPVRVVIEGYKMFYIDAIYGNNKLLFINIEDLFNTLNIPCVVAKDGNSVSGFIEKESQVYSIDLKSKQLKIGNRTIDTQFGVTKELGALYMESSLFDEAFGITLTFNLRSLTILLKSNFELPIFKQLRIEKLRTNVSKIKGEVVADTIIKRNYHLFKFGSMDWAAASYQTWNGPTNHLMSLGVGTELAGGEANASVNYYTQYKFDNRQVNYLWRWIDNDKSLIKQAQLGKISNQTISFINAPVVGATIRNSPTTVRKASGYYTINERTEPNWSVELYINNVLVDYTKADASGLFQFKVPIVYGYTTLKLKFYGPLGEERTDERTMNMPYSIMPKGEFEYGLSGGVLEDTLSSRFGKAEFNYGVNRMLTLGGGVEYLSSIAQNPYIPYAKLTFQPFSQLTVNGEYAHGVRSRGVLDLYFHRDALLELDYAKYDEGQLATRFNAPEERKAKLSIPLRLNKLAGFLRLDYTQFVYSASNFNQGTMMFSAYYRQFSANSSTMVNWTNNMSPYSTSDLALSYRSKSGYTFRPSAQYNIRDGNVITAKLTIEKYIPKGNFSVSYERNILYNDNFITANLKYDLAFARTNFSISRASGSTVTSQSLQGSLAFGGDNGFVYHSNNSAISKGGLLLYPFLDNNNNGILDPGEHLVKVNNVSIMGGRVLFNDKDSIVRVPDLNAFTTYLVEFQDNDLENISWRFKKRTYQVLIDPNQFKRVNIPVIAVGEVSGMVYLNNEQILKGLQRVVVKFYKKHPSLNIRKGKPDPELLLSDKPVAETMSEADGYIYYMGLEPGDYIAKIDPDQLSNLNMTALPQMIQIKINQNKEGDIVSGLDFILKKKMDVTMDSTTMLAPTVPQNKTQDHSQAIPVGKPKKKAGSDIVSKAKSQKKAIQVAAFLKQEHAVVFQQLLKKQYGYTPMVVFEGGYYKVRLMELTDPKRALLSLQKLFKEGFKEAFVVDA